MVAADFRQGPPLPGMTGSGAGVAERGPRGQTEMIAPQAHLSVIKNLELSDAETPASSEDGDAAPAANRTVSQ